MSIHSYSKILLHIIWGTLNREKLINKKIKQELELYIKNYCKQLSVHLIEVYVNPDHVHMLIDLPTTITVEEFVKRIKGSLSHYINKERLTPTKFSWGRGYAVFSVSESNKQKVIDYIRNQEEHHRKKSFEEEVDLFLNKYGIDKRERVFRNR